MKVVLISFDQMIITYGVRLLSSCLKKEGFKTEIIFARAIIGKQLPKNVLEEIRRRTKDACLVGVSLMSNYFPHAVLITKFLKRELEVPIIWGGVHPTFCPEKCLEYADMVCIGEGEKPTVALVKKLAKKKKITEIPSIWSKKDGKIIKNKIGPLIHDLDSLPLPDFGPQGHFIRNGDKLEKMTNNLFKKFLTKRETANGEFVPEYYISTSRGCPFNCSYCASNTIKALYPKQNFFRLRSPEKVVEEVCLLRRKYDFIKWIYFSDDDLFCSPTNQLKKFCQLWQERVRLPFYATVTPWSYNEKKFNLLLKAGLGIVNMGIQTVSKRGGRIYNRLVSKKKLKAAINSIHKLSPPLPPIYDFILDNPYERDQDKLENLDFILKIPNPKKFQLFSLVPFPGTEIYTRMKSDGLLTNEEKMIYQKSYSYPEANYINMLMFLANTSIPDEVVKLLRQRIFLLLFNNSFSKWLFRNIPYSAFLVLARNVFNSRFWQFNIAPKGEN